LVSLQVFGSGPIDLVFVPGFVSHIEAYWDHPDLARWLLRLASFARVATFDKRGTGLSDRVSESQLLSGRIGFVVEFRADHGMQSSDAAVGLSRRQGHRYPTISATHPHNPVETTASTS
jgi:pimeloyl-ACP methyl ester carboxylesterase